MSPSHWIIGPVFLPLVAGLLTFLLRRGGAWIALFATLASGVAVAALTRHLLRDGPFRYAIGDWPAPLGIGLRLDGPAVLFLLMTATTSIAVTLYARGYFHFRISTPRGRRLHEEQQRFFWPLWLLLLAALNGIFLAADIFNLYVNIEIISIAAAALAALSGRPAARIAAFRYLLVSLLDSLSYLLGVAFLYRTLGVLDLAMLGDLSRTGPAIRAGLALLSVGLLLKTALFPLHFWLPPAHANALAPVSAILSSLVIKGSFYLLFRFWFEVFTPAVSAGACPIIGLLGAGAILWGSVQALQQQRLKLLIAYSTVSQIGYLFVAFPLLRNGAAAEIWAPVIFMALGHAWAKAAMFMAAGTIFLHMGHDRINELAGVRTFLPISVFACAIAGVNLMGLPPSGAFVAKWQLIGASLSGPQWWWGPVLLAGGFLACAYVYRLVSRFFVAPVTVSARYRMPSAPLLEWPPFALALLSFFLGILAPYATMLLNSGAGPAIAAGGLP